MSKPPTMSEIARICGVSQATVSLVLNNAPGTRISPSTRARVLEIAEELGYKRSRVRGQKMPAIALVIDDMTSTPHVAALIEGVVSAAAEHGFLAIVLPVGEDGLDQALDSPLGASFAGVIYAKLVTQTVERPLALADRPSVLLNCFDKGGISLSVVPADYAAGMVATLSLIDAGHQRIACIGGEPAIIAARERRKGYRNALATRDIPVDPALIRMGGWSLGGGYEAMSELLDLEEPPTAVFALCDRTALGIYAAAAEHGLKIPEDLSVIGFDNETFTATMAPPLTTMQLPHSQMGEQAVEMLLDLIGNAASDPVATRTKVECEMISRASVATPPSRPGR